MKKILITGANSYIGISFERYIKENFPNDYMVDTMDMIDGSWRGKDFSGYDSIFHVAGIAHQKETKENAQLYYKINRDLAIETAKKAKIDGVKQFVFMSSMSVYGVQSGEIDLYNDVNPVSNYGKSKLQAEQGLLKLNEENFIVTILRPPMVYGKGCKGNYNFLRKWIKTFHIFPEYSNRRSMISIENLRAFVCDIIAMPKAGVLFPRDETYMCTTELVKRIAEEDRVKVLYTNIFNPLIRHIKIGLILKVFGDYVYKEDNV